MPFNLAILCNSMAHCSKRPLVASQRGDSIMYFGMQTNRTHGRVVNTRNETQFLVAQNINGIMHMPTVQPMHCIIAIWARSSLKFMFQENV